MTRACALTTFDNPFDPFDEFAQWLLYDNAKGYGTAGYLARIARMSDELTEDELNEEKERAIDEIIKNDFRNIYKKVVKN